MVGNLSGSKCVRVGCSFAQTAAKIGARRWIRPVGYLPEAQTPVTVVVGRCRISVRCDLRPVDVQIRIRPVPYPYGVVPIAVVVSVGRGKGARRVTAVAEHDIAGIGHVKHPVVIRGANSRLNLLESD